jgi:hypothetical protein
MEVTLNPFDFSFVLKLSFVTKMSLCAEQKRLLSKLTVEKDNAQQHGNVQCSLKIGEELDRSTKTALDDSKTDPGSDRNQTDQRNDLIKLSHCTRHWFMNSIVRNMWDIVV